MNFKDATVLVTGASAGIGKEFARQFHGLGSSLILVARREDRLRDACDEFNKIRDGSARFFCVDLAKDDERMEELLSYIRGNRIDILVNNAGRGSFGYFHTLSLDDELEMVALNVSATLKLSHSVIPQMKERRSGAIISVSSVVGFQPLPFMATYAATKVFNLNHALSLRHELSEYGIRVLTVCPGPTETEFKGVANLSGIRIAVMPQSSPHRSA